MTDQIQVAGWWGRVLVLSHRRDEVIFGVVNVQLTMNNEHLGNAKIQVFDIYGKLVGVVETLRAEFTEKVPLPPQKINII